MDKKKKEKMATFSCVQTVATDKNKKDQKWVKPELTDVSNKVMAQPYIRFT